LQIGDNAAQKGLLLPRVPLTATNVWGLAGTGGIAQNGMLVYNTNTTTANPATDVTPGTYCWNGSQWMRMMNTTNVLSIEDTTAWMLNGNNNSSIKTLGTTSNTDLPVITAGTEKMRITQSGNVGIGVTNPATTLDIKAAATGQGFKLVDGNQSEGAVLTSDANGVGTWAAVPVGTLVAGTVPAAPVVYLPTSFTTALDENSQIFYTGCFITLPSPGKWRIEFRATIQATGSAVIRDANNRGFAALMLSTSSTTAILPPIVAGTNIRSIIIPNLYSSGQYVAGVPYEKHGGGAIFVDEPSATTLYLWAFVGGKNTTTGVGTLPNVSVFELSSRNGETGTFGPYTFIVATKL
jgi:hypothetical protein